jgi:replicative DNA helicase
MSETSQSTTLRSTQPKPTDEATNALLALVLRGDEAGIIAVRDLKSEDLPMHRQQMIFDAIGSLQTKGVFCDAITVGAELEHTGFLSQVGGIDILHKLAA